MASPVISFTEHFKCHLLYFIIYQGAGTCITQYRLHLSRQPQKGSWWASAHSREGRAELTEGTTPWLLSCRNRIPSQLLPSPAHLHFPTPLPSASPLPGCLPHMSLTTAPGVFTPGLGFAFEASYYYVIRNPCLSGKKRISFTVLLDSKGHMYTFILASVSSREYVFIVFKWKVTENRIPLS